jgi:hypothetical protein
MTSCAVVARGLLLGVALGIPVVAVGTTAAPPNASVYSSAPRMAIWPRFSMRLR